MRETYITEKEAKKKKKEEINAVNQDPQKVKTAGKRP
jgi:hypothetical protein